MTDEEEGYVISDLAYCSPTTCRTYCSVLYLYCTVRTVRTSQETRPKLSNAVMYAMLSIFLQGSGPVYIVLYYTVLYCTALHSTYRNTTVVRQLGCALWRLFVTHFHFPARHRWGVGTQGRKGIHWSGGIGCIATGKHNKIGRAHV